MIKVSIHYEAFVSNSLDFVHL